MEPLQITPHHLSSSTRAMNSFPAKFRSKLLSNSANFKGIFVPYLNLEGTHKLTRRPSCSKSGLKDNVRVRVSEAQLRENWLTSLSCPFPGKDERPSDDLPSSSVGQECVLGIDPDLSGALALLKNDESGCSAQVFDAPYLQVPVGKRIRRRLDAKSIVQLLQSLNVPIGTTAFVEQSIPYPQDGKQGWWSGGFGYGLWIGILVASGLSVVPVPSLLWKNVFDLSGGLSNKDDSRKLASMMFPSLSALFKRKKDHGRAEALLIAAYGRRIHLNK